ncbi:hypothetical protein STEG23_026601, partial [Scotinomys teguina]
MILCGCYPVHTILCSFWKLTPFPAKNTRCFVTVNIKYSSVPSRQGQQQQNPVRAAYPILHAEVMSKRLGDHNLFLGPDGKVCLFVGCLLNGATVLERKDRCRASDTSDHGSVPLLAASRETVSDTTVVTFPASEGQVTTGPLTNKLYLVVQCKSVREEEAEIDGDDTSPSRVLERVSHLCGSRITDEDVREPQSTLWLSVSMIAVPWLILIVCLAYLGRGNITETLPPSDWPRLPQALALGLLLLIKPSNNSCYTPAILTPKLRTFEYQLCYRISQYTLNERVTSKSSFEKVTQATDINTDPSCSMDLGSSLARIASWLWVEALATQIMMTLAAAWSPVTNKVTNCSLNPDFPVTFGGNTGLGLQERPQS